jgi:cysteine desulfurase family protein
MDIYLDNAATSFPKPPSVLEAMKKFFFEVGANAGRSAYRNAQQSSRMVFETRESIAQLIGAADSSRIIFTSNATESLNIAIMGILKEGDHVITSSIEHNSVMRPLRFLEKTRGITVNLAQCLPTGELDPDEVKRSIKENTKLIIATSASNVIGTILPIAEIGEIARAQHIPFLVDGAQTVGSNPINVEKENIDLLAFSGHKALLGPQGTGCLYIRDCIDLSFFKLGGTGSASDSDTQPEFLPDRFESGTLNLIGIAGLKAAVDFVLEQGIGEIRKKEKEITEYLLYRLLEMKQVALFGPKDSNRRMPVISISTGERDISEVGRILDSEFHIAVRCGLQCSPQCHKTIGTFPTGTLRISPGYFSKKEEIDALIAALKEILK